MRVVARVFLLLSIAAAGGCATTSEPSAGATTPRPSKGSRRGGRKPLVEPTRDVVHPTCRTRDRLLSPAARGATDPVIGRSALGWALVWSERAGERSAVRFLAVDGAGLPRSPSAEVVDRDGDARARTIELAGDGHVVTWVEGGKCYARKIDAHGRPQSDVAPTTCPTPGPVVPSACVPSADAVRCKAGRGELVLPPDASVAAQQLGDAGDLVIASDAGGLHLFSLDCVAR